MDHITLLPYDGVGAVAPLLAFAGVLLLASFVAGGFAAREGDRRGEKLATVLFFSLGPASIVVTLVAVGIGGQINLAGRTATLEAINSYAASIDDRYGLELDRDDIRDLAFPGAKPAEKKAFAAITLRGYADRKLTTTEVTLLWDGTDYALVTVGEDGSWAELPTR